jgi:hypothetical protein
MQTINLGKFNCSFDLTLNINIRNNKINMNIPLPENYPLTNIGTSEIIKSKGLFTAEFLIISPNNRSWYSHLADNVNQLFNINSNSAVILNRFYNTAKVENIPTTPEEKLMLSGLGKKFICTGISYIVNYFDLNPDNTLILLQASGGTVTTDLDKLRSQEYLTLDRNSILKIYQDKYPEDFNSVSILFDKYSNADLADALVALENNERLIQYYIDGFGFQPLNYISMETMMGTILSIFLTNCNKI